MMTLEQMTTFLAWCTAINIGLLLLTTLAIMAMKGWISDLHGAMFSLDPVEVRRMYFGYLGTFKIVVLVFFLVPYLALRLALQGA